jgi:hypothetical protein
LVIFWIGSWFVCLFRFAVLEFELRAYTLSHSTSPFLWRVFSRPYLPGAGFEPQSSWSLPPG